MIRKQTKTKTWTTKDGSKIRICDMDDEHLYNTITLLNKQSRMATSNAILTGYSMLGMLQGEMAIDSVEIEI